MTVDGAESASNKVPLALSVVRKHLISVLKESDGDEPVVHEEVRSDIVASDLGEATVVTPGEKSGEGETDAEVRSENLTTVTGVEDDGVGVEVVGVLGVRLLTGSVADEVHRPAEKLLEHEHDEGVERSVFEDFVHLLESRLLLLGGETSLGSSLGDKDLVASHVTGRSVMLGVGDAPRVVRNEERRVDDPADCVVEGLGLAEGLMTAFVGNDPETGARQTSGKGIGEPSDVTKDLTSGTADELTLSAEEAVDERRRIDEAGDEEAVHGNVRERAKCAAFKAVRRDDIEEFFDSEVGRGVGHGTIV